MTKFGLTVVAVFYVAGVFCDDKYTSQYNNVDIDEILRNQRLLNSYFSCLSTGENCTPDAEELRRVLPEAIQTGCIKCTDEHKGNAKKVSSFLIKQKPDMWQKLIALYDPNNVYREKYRDQLKAEGFDI